MPTASYGLPFVSKKEMLLADEIDHMDGCQFIWVLSGNRYADT